MYTAYLCSDVCGCLTVEICSLVHCSSLVLARACLREGSLLADSAEGMRNEDADEQVTVVFSQRCACRLKLEKWTIVKIYPPW